MSTQMSLFGAPRTHDGVALAYAPNHQERPADLARLRESAETVEARVLAWFEEHPAPATPTTCAESLGLKLTTVRPRICQLAKRVEGPRLERCAWLPRKPTEDGGSEGWYRFKRKAQQ